ncbi:MAG: MFS transporter [archaeon]
MIRLISFYRNYRKDKHYTLHVIYLLVLLWAISYMSFEYFIPVFLESTLGNLALVGMFLSLPSIVGILLDVYFGHLQTKRSIKLLFFAALTLFFCAGVSILFGGQYIPFILLGMMFYGVGFDFFDITAYTGIFDNSTKRESSTNLAVRDVFECVGLMIGAVLAGFVLAESGNGLLYIFIGVVLVAIILSQVLLRKKRVKFRVKDEPHSFFEHLRLNLVILRDDLKVIFRTRMALMCLILIFIITFFDGMFFGFEPLFAQTLKNPYLDERIVGGLLLATYVAPIIFFEYLFGRFSDRFGKKSFIILGMVVASLSLFLLSSTESIFLVFVSIFFVSFGVFSISWSAITGLYEDEMKLTVGKRRDGESVGVMELFMNSGYVLGPLVGGFLTHFFMFRKTFLIVGFLFVLVVAVAVLVFSYRKK